MAFLKIFLRALSCSLCLLPAAKAQGLADPFDSSALHAAAPGDSRGGGLKGACQATDETAPLTLVQVVDLALCNNPQTRLAWANARAQAAQVGIAESAYLPTLAVSAGRSRIDNDSGSSDLRYMQTTASLSASYLLYDFGGRAATLESARQLMTALAATQDATLQAVFLAAVQAYFQVHATTAALVAARQSELASAESLKAATARYRAGTATPADRLQAQTAAAQTTLSRIRAAGDATLAFGTLANALGLDAQQPLTLAAPAETMPAAEFARNLDELIAMAKRARPDLIAAEAQVRAAEAGIDLARSGGRPSLSLNAASSRNDSGLAGTTRGSSIGVALEIPLFSGFNTTYRVRSAEAQLAAREAQRDLLARQVSLDVWRNYHALTTSIAAVQASVDLLASAQAAEQVASGRYRAGVGVVLDLLNSQSALASARQQNIQALYNWHIAKAALAQAMGRLGFEMIESTTMPAQRASPP